MSNQRRFSFGFSLRSLLVLTAIAGVLFGVRSARQRRNEATRRITELGGILTYDLGGDEEVSLPPAKKRPYIPFFKRKLPPPPGSRQPPEPPKWWSWEGATTLAFGPETKVTRIQLSGVKLTDNDLKFIGALNELRHLALAKTNISDEGLAHISSLIHLRILRLQGTRISDEGLGFLRGMKALEELNVKGTNVTLQGVRELQKHLPRARVLTNRD